MGKLVYKAIVSLGHTHTNNFDFMLEMDSNAFYDGSLDDWKKRYTLRLKELSQADLCVFEVSTPSLSVGQLLQEALNREKPTIALYSTHESPKFLMGTAENEKRLQLLAYTKDDIKQVLKDAFETAEELLTTRFTMLLSSDLKQYLQHIEKTEGLSHSEYIRSLLYEDRKRRGK